AAFYVIDKNRSWYNATHHSIQSAMVPALTPFQEVITLGNSMGGFGAIYFAPLFPACRASIAFSPHFSIAPGIGPRRDRRSRKFRDRIKSWPVSHALQHARDTICYFLFYGSKDMRDRRHAELFLNPSRKVSRKRPRNMHIFSVDGCGHEIAAFLKSRHCLRPLLDGILHQNFREQHIGHLFKSSGIRFHHNTIPFSFRAFMP
ncbi:MAG TPA: hypothetical protein VH255_00025, partial [Verrucomicrobiae bacterium]|nr:hypothetical protein [Verrucomicrobiae bacterium]